MAGLGYRNWSAGDVPTADQFDQYLQEQVVGVYADAADRDTQLSVVKAEGMVAFLLDTNTLTVYSGSAWSTVGPVHGALTSWAPVVTQSSGVAVTNNGSSYLRIGRWIQGSFIVTVTGSGTAGAAITVSLPVVAAFTSSHFLSIGFGHVLDISTTPDDVYASIMELASSTTLRFRGASADPGVDAIVGQGFSGDSLFANGLDPGDNLSGTFAYLAASDA